MANTDGQIAEKQNAKKQIAEKQNAKKQIAKEQDAKEQNPKNKIPDEQIPQDFLIARKKAKRNKRIKAAIIAGIALIIIAGAGLAFGLQENSEQEKPTTQSYTQTVEKGTLALTIEGSGTLAAKSSTSENASVSGSVKKIYVEEGDKVSKGDTLFTITSDTLNKELNSAAKSKSSAYSSYAKAKSALAKAKKSLKKAKSGSASSTSAKSSKSANSAKSAVTAKTSNAAITASSSTATNSTSTATQTAQEAVTKAQENLAQAKATYKEACSTYTDAANAMDDLTISASTSGKVSAVNIEAGDSIEANSTDAAVEIINTDTMTLSVNVSEYEIANIKRGQSATINITTLDKNVKASVKSVSLTANSSTDSSTAYYPVTLVIKNPTSKMLTGMNATATITYKQYKNYLLVPTSAISTMGNASTVTIQAQDGSTTQVEVQVIAESDDTSAVQSDALCEGDSIVVNYQVNTDDSNSSDAFGADQSAAGSGQGFGAMGGQQGFSPNGGDAGSGNGGGGSMPSPPDGGNAGSSGSSSGNSNGGSSSSNGNNNGNAGGSNNQ